MPVSRTPLSIDYPGGSCTRLIVDPKFLMILLATRVLSQSLPSTACCCPEWTQYGPALLDCATFIIIALESRQAWWAMRKAY